MKLIKEFIIKEIFLLIAALAIIELFIMYLLKKRTKIIYEETYDETMEKIMGKTLEGALKLEEFISNYVAKYLGDLKIIAKHSLLFNVNTSNESNNLFYNDTKNIYFATLERLNGTEFESFQSEEENLYIKYFEDEFENKTNPNSYRSCPYSAAVPGCQRINPFRPEAAYIRRFPWLRSSLPRQIWPALLHTRGEPLLPEDL